MQHLILGAGHRPQPNQAMKKPVLFGERQFNLTERRAQKLIEQYLKGSEAILVPAHEASWNASCQGPDYRIEPNGPTNQEREQKLDNAFTDFLNDPVMEKQVDELWAEQDRIEDYGLQRQVEELYDTYHGATKNVDFKKKLTDLTIALQGQRAKHELKLDGQALSEMDVTGRRMTSQDPVEMKKLWDLNNSYGQAIFNPQTGQTFAEGLLELFRKRNEAAELDNRDSFGDDTGKYMDAYTWSLYDQKIKEADLIRLTDEVEEATREPFRKLVDALDDISADRFGIPKEDARQSWFQSAYGKYTNMGNIRRLIDFNPDKYFEDLDLEDALLRTAEMQGQRAEMQAILDRSYYFRNGEKKSALYFDPDKDNGKRQGAFMTAGHNPPETIKVFSSVKPSLKEQMYDAMRTALHETPGHGFDYNALEKNLSKLVRSHHLTTTESHAFLHETLITDREWLLKVPHKKDGTPLFDEKKVDEYLAKAVPLIQLSNISGIRSTMSIMEFERLAYHHLSDEKKKEQDAQAKGQPYTPKTPQQLVKDLNDIWWSVRERFMMEKRPTGKDAEKSGWAWLPHYIGSTAYYPNYFQADVLRAMKSRFIKKNFGTLLSEKARKWLNNSLKTGSLHRWDSIIESMLGERLNAAALKGEYARIQIPRWK